MMPIGEDLPVGERVDRLEGRGHHHAAREHDPREESAPCMEGAGKNSRSRPWVRSRGFGSMSSTTEEDEHRHRGPQADEVLVVVRQVAEEVALGQADDDRAHERQRQRAQPPEDGGGVGVHDDERERPGVEGDAGGDQDAAEGRERGADRPAVDRHPIGSGAVEQRERPIVDVGPHGDADARAKEEEPEPDRHQDGDGDGDGLVVGDRRRPRGRSSRPGRRAPSAGSRPTSRSRSPARSCRRARLIETTSFVASLVPTNPRMITRSSRSPNNGARTPSTTNTATGAGHPQSKRSCQ